MCRSFLKDYNMCNRTQIHNCITFVEESQFDLILFDSRFPRQQEVLCPVTGGGRRSYSFELYIYWIPVIAVRALICRKGTVALVNACLLLIGFACVLKRWRTLVWIELSNIYVSPFLNSMCTDPYHVYRFMVPLVLSVSSMRSALRRRSLSLSLSLLLLCIICRLDFAFLRFCIHWFGNQCYAAIRLHRFQLIEYGLCIWWWIDISIEMALGTVEYPEEQLWLHLWLHWSVDECLWLP